MNIHYNDDATDALIAAAIRGKQVKMPSNEEIQRELDSLGPVTGAEQELISRVSAHWNLSSDLKGVCSFVKDRFGRFISVNAAFCDSVGMDREQIIGAKDKDIYPSDLAKKYFNDDQIIRNSGDLLEKDDEIYESSRWTRTTVSVVKKCIDGKIYGYFWRDAGEVKTISSESLVVATA